MKEFSEKINKPLKTIQEWRYNNKRYIPTEIIPGFLKNQLEILDEQDNNWGKIKGGQKAYGIILKKYGQDEIKKRQRNGGKKAIIERRKKEKPLIIDIRDPLFLEFYGILLGDGWLSKLHYKNKTTHLIGISGHLIKDKDFHNNINKNIQKLFNRNPYLKEIKRYNARELLFSHKELHEFLNNKFNFPIGLKKDLQLPKEILDQGFHSVKYIIRGVFDTDGCFYLDKTPVGKPYPCISLTMKEPILMQQIYNSLLSNGFKAYHYQSRGIDKIILKGSIQVKKWMKEIGSSNPFKLMKMQKALVVQPG